MYASLVYKVLNHLAEKKEEEAGDRFCPSYMKVNEIIFVEAGVPMGKINREPSAVLMSSWESLSPEQQFTEDVMIKQCKYGRVSMSGGWAAIS